MRGQGILVLVLLGAGCQQAVKYGPPPPTVSTPTVTAPEPLPTLDDRLYWNVDRLQEANDTIPLIFVVAEKSPAQWAGLPEYWNPSVLVNPAGVAALFRPAAFEAGLLVALAGPPRVEIRVPRGLPDPVPFFPPDDPPTLGKWLLGRRLFYDSNYLTPRKELSCASCHDPRQDFASHLSRDGWGLRLNTQSLWNVAYQPRIFWDGRTEVLESCLQQTFEDEREPTPAGKHAWGGAITRLVGNSVYRREFQHVFAVLPNQDNVGRALATYLRTLLSGNSVYDNAVVKAKAAGKETPEAVHFEAALADSKEREKNVAEVARELHQGYQLFHDRVAGSETACVKCHGGPLFTDREYHNLGLHGGEVTPTNYAGRMASLPPGRRTLAAMGAFRTPSLRNVARTGPYFHTGQSETLESTVNYHLGGARESSFTDPLFLTPTGNKLVRPLSEADLKALIRFLRALDGEPVPSALLQPPW